MKIRTIFTSLFLAALTAFAIVALIWANISQGTDEQATQQEILTSRSTTTAPLPTDNGISVPYGDADQAAQRPTTTPTYPHQTITQPTPNSDLDRQDPQAVVTEAIILYTSRTSATDTTYQNQLQPLTTEALATELHQIRLKAFDGQYPIAVKEATIGDNIKEWGIDTPARYSHYATATVDTENNGTYQVNYRVAAAHTQNGWIVTDLAIDSWSKKNG